MNKEDLLELREVFRTRMEREDFCIGQEQVEKLFRELLGEPEPVEAPLRQMSPEERAKLQQILEVESEILLNKVQDIFTQDNAFYASLKKR